MELKNSIHRIAFIEVCQDAHAIQKSEQLSFFQSIYFEGQLA